MDEHVRHNELIRSHFNGIAPQYNLLKARNPYYHSFLKRWCRAMAPPERRVLDVGCGRGDVLAAMQPSFGVGIDLSDSMTALARSDHPGLSFANHAIEDFEGDGSFDTVLAINALEYTWDIGAALSAMYRALRDNGRVLITAANPVWSPVFHAASAVGLRIPDCHRLFITNRDLMNALELAGFEIVHEEMNLAVPKRVPWVSEGINTLVSQTPILRLVSSTQLIVARKVPTNRREYSVSVIVPCHNERDNVSRCVATCPVLGTSTELIVVDDGSVDGTAAQAEATGNHGVDVRVISYPRRQGKGHAVAVGFDAARGDIVIVLDADLTVDPTVLHPLYEAFATGRAEFVNCTRFIYPMEGRAMKWMNYVGNRLFTIMVSMVMERRVSDTLCGTKAMFRLDYQHMTMGRDPWGDYDFLFGAAALRLSLKELPVHYRERTAGDSKMKVFRHTLNLIRMCWIGLAQIKGHQPIPPSRVKVARESTSGD